MPRAFLIRGQSKLDPEGNIQNVTGTTGGEILCVIMRVFKEIV